MLTINKKIAFMINKPLKASPAKPPENPSPTFSPIICKAVKKTMGGRKNENTTGNFPYSFILLSYKENYCI